ncbi:MAG: LLM class flavin-dependent oxidoreductase [Candidatus Thorarchaeota archaeon]
MKWGIALNVRDTISKTVDKSIIADRGGMDQIWVTDFPALRYAPTVATAVAEKTTDCRIGVGLMSPLLYSSSHIVQFMTTLIKSHGERFDLLVGPGDRHALESVGVVVSPKAILERMKKALSEIKSGLTEANLDTRVLVGAQGPKMIEISRGVDGVLLNYSDLEMAKWAMNQLSDNISKRFQVGIFPPAYIGPCDNFITNTAISYSAAMVALGLGKTVTNLFGVDYELKNARKLLKIHGGINDEVVRSIGDRILKRFAFCGSPKQLYRYIKELEEIGYTNVVLGPPVGMSKKSIENLISVKTNIQI